MKHANLNTLNTIEPVLNQIRLLPRLNEKKPGIFYLKSSAFLHFHEDISGIYADFKVNKEWHRVKVNSEEEQALLIKTITQLTK